MLSISAAAKPKEASRERVEAFLHKLAEEATRDRIALLCQLNSYG
jgi:hypothetical protein